MSLRSAVPRTALLLAVLLSAVPALALRLELEGPRRVLRPGEAVTVRWEGLPPETREVELLLELAGGTVRLTGSVHAAHGRLTLRVPAVVAGTARFRLRYGMEGREVLGPATHRFTIVPPAGTWSLPGFRGGELWLGGGSRPLAPRSARAPNPWLSPTAGSQAAAVPGRSAGRETRTAWGKAPDPGTSVPPTRRGACGLRLPRDVPQRE